MEIVSLSAAMRNNLLLLQNTASLVTQTQSRLFTGLRVASAIDDPVAYFQAKSLLDYASDIGVRKDQINQGISTVNAATDGLLAITQVVDQLQGLVYTSRSATSDSEIALIVDQFNNLRYQINSLSRDSSYQGLNLIYETGQLLNVNFSNVSSSFLNIESVNATAQGIGIDAVRNIQDQFATTVPPVGILTGKVAFDYQGSTANTIVQNGQTLTFTLAMTGNVLIGPNTGVIQFSYGTLSVSIAAGGGSPSFSGVVAAALGDVTDTNSPLGTAGAPTNITEAGGSLGSFGDLAWSVAQKVDTSSTGAIYQAALDEGLTNAQAQEVADAAYNAANGTWGPGSFSVMMANSIQAAVTEPTVQGVLSAVYGGAFSYAVRQGYSDSGANIIASAAYAAASNNIGSMTGTLDNQMFTVVMKGAAGGVAGVAAVAARNKVQEFGGSGGGAGLMGGLTDGMVIQVEATMMGAADDPSGNQAKIDGFTITSPPLVMHAFDGQRTFGVGMLRTMLDAQEQLGNATAYVRSASQSLGLNIALLQVRLDFSTSYINTMTEGAGLLTLANMNEESARMLALQTRQQLGLQALSMSTGDGILQLFQ